MRTRHRSPKEGAITEAGIAGLAGTQRDHARRGATVDGLRDSRALATLLACILGWGCGRAGSARGAGVGSRDGGASEAAADDSGSRDASGIETGADEDAAASDAAVGDSGDVENADADAASWSGQAPQIIFSRGCFSGNHGLYIIRPDGTDERVVYSAGHSLKPELVYGQDHLLLSVDQSLYTVSLTTFQETLLVPSYLIGFSKPIPGNRWVYGSGAGAPVHMHVLALDTLADLDLGPGMYCGSAQNGDLVYASDASGSRTLNRYRVNDGSTTTIALAPAGCGVLADGSIYFGTVADGGIDTDLYMTDPGGANPHFLSRGWDGSSPLPLPDGRVLVSSYQGAGGTQSNYLAIDTQTAVTQTILASPYDESLRGGVSATGRLVLLLYGAGASVPPDIWSIHYDGANPVKLFAGQGASSGNVGIDVVARSPASRVVSYRVRSDYYMDLFAVDDRGGMPAMLGTTENHDGNVALLPNEGIVFTRDGALFTMGLDGSGGRMVVSTPEAKHIQAVLPDGRFVFETLHASSDDLSVANPDGSTVVPLGHVMDCHSFELLAP
jgi:hypothetical protein